jgi:hypothetical protein
MTQEEYGVKCDQNNAKLKWEQYELVLIQKKLKDELRELTKKYQEEKAAIEREIDQNRIAMAEAIARAARTKSELNDAYLASLKEDLEK